MNGIIGKRIIAERQQRAMVSIHTDENIVINNIVGADGSETDGDGNVYVEVHFDIKNGYKFDPHVTTNTGVFVWDSLNGRFLGRKPADAKLQISVTSVKQIVKNMKGRHFEICYGGEIYRTYTNFVTVVCQLEQGERLPNTLDDFSIFADRDYCLNPMTGEILLYNMDVPDALSKPIVSISGSILTFTPGEDWESVTRIILYEGRRYVWNWKKEDLVNNTLDLSNCPNSVFSNGTHTLSVVYSQLTSTEPCLDDGPNSDRFEYTVNRTDTTGGSDE